MPSRAAEPPSTLTVTGNATVARQPDRALLALSVITGDDQATASVSQNSATYNAVVARLRAAGVPEAAIRTASYSLTFVPKPQPGAGYTPPHTGFVVQRTLAITIDNLSIVGAALDAAVAGGATEINGVSFGLRDERSARMSAATLAVQDAQAQAQTLAHAAGIHITGIRRMTTGEAQGPALRFAPKMLAAANEPVPTQIPASPVDVTASVTVTFTLGR